METINNRLEFFFKSKGYRVTEFEAFCSITKGVISGAIRENRVLGVDKIERILNKFPELNLYWLISGDGEMFRTINMEDNTNVQIGNYLVHGGNKNQVYNTIDIPEYVAKVAALTVEVGYLKQQVADRDRIIKFMEIQLQKE